MVVVVVDDVARFFLEAPFLHTRGLLESTGMAILVEQLHSGNGTRGASDSWQIQHRIWDSESIWQGGCRLEGGGGRRKEGGGSRHLFG